MDPLLDLSFEDISSLLAPFGFHFVILDFRWTPQKLYFFAPFFGPVPGGPGDTKATQEGSGMRYWDGTLY